MSLNKLTNTQVGKDLKLKIGCSDLDVETLTVRGSVGFVYYEVFDGQQIDELDVSNINTLYFTTSTGNVVNATCKGFTTSGLEPEKKEGKLIQMFFNEKAKITFYHLAPLITENFIIFTGSNFLTPQGANKLGYGVALYTDGKWNIYLQ